MVGGKRFRGAQPVGQRFKDPAPTDWDTRRPYFCLQSLTNLTDCSEEQQAALSDALWRRSQMTWRELTLAPRHGLGSEQIKAEQLPSPPAGVTDDVTYLAFRFHGKAPMVGYRTENVFHVLWLDH